MVRASRSSLGFVVFFIAGLAETHRLPFDLPEAESELVAGYHSEYSGMKFAMFMVGEYVGISLLSALLVTLFFGGWHGAVVCRRSSGSLIKMMVFICFFILLRAALPRPRYDQLMALGLEGDAAARAAEPGGDRRRGAGARRRRDAVMFGRPCARIWRVFLHMLRASASTIQYPEVKP